MARGEVLHQVLSFEHIQREGADWKTAREAARWTLPRLVNQGDACLPRPVATFCILIAENKDKSIIAMWANMEIKRLGHSLTAPPPKLRILCTILFLLIYMTFTVSNWGETGTALLLVDSDILGI